MRILLIINFVWFFIFISHWNTVSCEIYYDRIELLNSSYLPDFYNVSLLRISKFNRTTYVMNLNVDFLQDFGEDIEMQTDFYYNRFNNNQYSKSPLGI